jgi:hypothetical protein
MSDEAMSAAIKLVEFLTTDPKTGEKDHKKEMALLLQYYHMARETKESAEIQETYANDTRIRAARHMEDLARRIGLLRDALGEEDEEGEETA